MRQLPVLERTLRRSLVYRGRVSRMITRSTLKRPCAFMHLPKCGGTSLSEGLYALVPLQEKIGILDSASIRRALTIYHGGPDDPRPYHDEGEHAAEVAKFREQLVIMHMAHRATLIHGHFLFSQKAHNQFGDRYAFVTIMRHPVARTISNYRMAHANGVFDGDFDAFLSSGMGRRMALHNLRYFAGKADVAPEEEAELLQVAKDNMAKFAVVGFIEEQDEFLAKFSDIFGAKPQIGHYNKAKDRDVSLTGDEMRRLEALCASDVELYDHARGTR